MLSLLELCLVAVPPCTGILPATPTGRHGHSVSATPSSFKHEQMTRLAIFYKMKDPFQKCLIIYIYIYIYIIIYIYSFPKSEWSRWSRHSKLPVKTCQASGNSCPPKYPEPGVLCPEHLIAWLLHAFTVCFRDMRHPIRAYSFIISHAVKSLEDVKFIIVYSRLFKIELDEYDYDCQ